MQKANKASPQPFNAKGWKIGIAVSQFNGHITKELLKGTLKRATDYDINPDKIDIVYVAGSVEIPLVLQQMAKTQKYKALLALGCVIKGETPHFDYVCKLVTDGVLRVQLDTQTTIGFGVLTCNNQEQAQARAHLGGEFLDAALQQAKALEQIR